MVFFDGFLSELTAYYEFLITTDFLRLATTAINTKNPQLMSTHELGSGTAA